MSVLPFVREIVAELADLGDRCWLPFSKALVNRQKIAKKNRDRPGIDNQMVRIEVEYELPFVQFYQHAIEQALRQIKWNHTPGTRPLMQLRARVLTKRKVQVIQIPFKS